MSTSDTSFNDNLDQLIKLLRKLKDKTAGDDIPGMPKMFFANFDFVINNYEMMKDHISDQLLSQFGEPIKQMVADMVKQLQEELGDDLDMIIEEKKEKKPASGPIILPESLGLDATLANIDEMLRQPGLSEAEINRLLDERSRFKGPESDPGE